MVGLSDSSISSTWSSVTALPATGGSETTQNGTGIQPGWNQAGLTVFELSLDAVFALVSVVLLYLVVLSHDVAELAGQRCILRGRESNWKSQAPTDSDPADRQRHYKHKAVFPCLVVSQCYHTVSLHSMRYCNHANTTS